MGKKNRPKDGDDVSVDDDFFHDYREERRQKRRDRRKIKRTVDNIFVSSRYSNYEDFEEVEYNDSDEFHYD